MVKSEQCDALAHELSILTIIFMMVMKLSCRQYCGREVVLLHLWTTVSNFDSAFPGRGNAETTLETVVPLLSGEVQVFILIHLIRVVH